MANLDKLVIKLSSEIIHIVGCSLEQEKLSDEDRRIVVEHTYVNCLANHLLSDIKPSPDCSEELLVKCLKPKINKIVDGMCQGIMNHLKGIKK